MIQSNKEYFDNPYYFFLKEKENSLVLYYNYSKNITEARLDDEKIEFNKKDKRNLKLKIQNILKTKKHKNKKELKGDLSNFKHKTETNELIDSDGSWSSSRIPILDPNISPRFTTDQSVYMSHITNDPVTRGYRVYYGESKMNEVDYSKAFGYEETKDMNGKKTYNFFIDKMGLDPFEARERTLQQGKNPNGEKTKKSKFKKDKNFIDRITLFETQRKQMIEMVEEIIKGKKVKPDNKNNISKFLESNLKSIKNLAKKEGLDLNQLIQILKQSE